MLEVLKFFVGAAWNSPTITGLLAPMLAKIALVAAFGYGLYSLYNVGSNVRNEVHARAINWWNGDMEAHRGPKWQPPGTRQISKPTYYSNEMSDVYIWRAKWGNWDYVLIGRENDIMMARPCDIRGWGLDSQSYVRDVAKPTKMFENDFIDRAAALEFLRTKITEEAIIPLTGGHKRAKVDGELFNITNAIN